MTAAHHRLQAQCSEVATTRRRGTTNGGAPASRGVDTTPPRPVAMGLRDMMDADKVLDHSYPSSVARKTCAAELSQAVDTFRLAGGLKKMGSNFADGQPDQCAGP
eukprot:SM000015S01240  [mRNA]  locus=s15:758380:759338:+ [translate_table: standard]